MNQGYKKWMAAVAFALSANAAGAAQVGDDNASVGGLDASALMAFYGVSLSTSPVNAVEDKAVWMAKVQGLIAQAPAWLQQNVLASKTSAEFAANLAILESMQKGALESSASAVKNMATSGKLKAKGDVNPDLGFSGPSDLVYTALSPCRIMDTRSASGASGVQGPIVGNTLYSIPGYITTGSNWSQYGQLAPLSDCLLNSDVGGNIWAVAIVITILNPDFDAYLGVSDSSSLSTVLSKVALNFTRGQGLSTMYIVPQGSNNIRFAMPAGLHANLIFDVVGYFANAQASALDCVDGPAGTAVIADTATGTAVSGACAAGYNIVGGSCDPTVYAMRLAGSRHFNPQTWACDYPNQSGASRTVSSTARCCRTPGR